MTNNPLGQPLKPRITEELARPILKNIIEELIADGWLVENSEGISGHLLVFGRPGQNKSTALGETLADLLMDLNRNLTQSGYLSPRLREVLLKAEQVNLLIKEPLSNQLSDLQEDDFDT